MQSSTSSSTQSSQRAWISGLLDYDADPQSARRALVDQFKMVPAVKLETFFDHLMPQPTEGLRTESQLDAFMEQLQEGPSAPLKRKGEEYSWSSFPESPESTDGLSEADTFQQLEHVVNDISAAASAYLTSLTGAEPVHRFFYKNNRAHRTPESLYRNNASRPDGYFLTYDPHDTVSDEKPRWWNIGPLGEFKKSSGKANAADDMQKVLWGMNRVMRKDPLRRAAYGFTMENTMTRFWFCDRSQVIASRTFDFFKDPKSLVRFFMTILFADRSALGWDPTMTRIEEDGGTQYDIEVHDPITRTTDTYRTVRLVSHVSADAIVGRGTRVWTARLKGQPSSSLVILKDYWVNSNRTREGEIVREVRSEGLRRGLESDMLEVLERHLPTVVTDGDVQISGMPDKTRLLPQITIDGSALEDVLKLSVMLFTSRDVTKDTPGSHFSPSSYVDQFPQRILRQGPKTHYRIVIMEVGHSLNEEHSLTTAFRAIEGIAECLLVLHDCGWVHRDISTGNIIVYEGRGILNDLEYAKPWRTKDPTGHTVRTGTQYFMSVEVDALSYLSRSIPTQPIQAPSPGRASGSNLNVLAISRMAALRPPAEFEAQVPVPDAPFQYHPLNDWESLFWVALYMILNKPVKPTGDRLQQSDERLSEQRKLARGYFYDYKTRRDNFCEVPRNGFDGFWVGLEACLHEDLLPVAKHLASVRRALVLTYVEAETDSTAFPDDEISILHMADHVVPYYRRIRAYFDENNIEIT